MAQCAAMDVQTALKQLTAGASTGLGGSGWFRRSNHQQLYFNDMGLREKVLEAVRQVNAAEWVDTIDPMPGADRIEAEKEPGQFRLPFLNSWVGDLAQTYNSEPSRVFTYQGEPLADDDPRLEALQWAYNELDVDTVLDEIDSYLYLYGNAVLRIIWNERTGDLVPDLFPSYGVRVVDDPMQAAVPLGVALKGTVLERDDKGFARKQDLWDCYDYVDNQFKTNGGAWMPLVTDTVPLVHFADCKQTNQTGYYVESAGPTLAKLNVALNEDFLCRIGLTTLMQAHGIMQVYGFDPQQKVTLGPDRAMRFSGDPDKRQGVEFANPGADLTSFMDVIDFLLHQAQTVYKIPVQKVDAGGDVSGRSQIEMRAPTMERRKQRLKTFRKPETQLCRVVVDNLRTYGDSVNGAPRASFPGALTDYNVKVQFAEPAAVVSVSEKIALEKHQLETGIKRKADLLFESNPDRFDSVEEAAASLTTNQSIVDDAEDADLTEGEE